MIIPAIRSDAFPRRKESFIRRSVSEVSLLESISFELKSSCSRRKYSLYNVDLKNNCWEYKISSVLEADVDWFGSLRRVDRELELSLIFVLRSVSILLKTWFKKCRQY